MKHKTEVAAATCAAAFVAVLAVSAYFDPSIRLLHAFEAAPYAAAGVLCLRRNKLGYALGTAGGAFWLWMAGFLTTFVANGFQQLVMLLRAGTLDRPDLLIAVPAAVAAGGLVLFSALGYARLPNKAMSDILWWAAALAAIPLFFLGIFALFAPRYLSMFESVF